MDTLISNVTIVTMNEKMDVLFGAFLGITDGKITSVSGVAYFYYNGSLPLFQA